MRTDDPATTTHATHTEGDHLLSRREVGGMAGEEDEKEKEGGARELGRRKGKEKKEWRGCDKREVKG